jgi:hypothetical protein
MRRLLDVRGRGALRLRRERGFSPAASAARRRLSGGGRPGREEEAWAGVRLCAGQVALASAWLIEDAVARSAPRAELAAPSRL